MRVAQIEHQFEGDRVWHGHVYLLNLVGHRHASVAFAWEECQAGSPSVVNDERMGHHPPTRTPRRARHLQAQTLVTWAFWDAELETLSSQVIAVFGTQALDDAVARAKNRYYQDTDDQEATASDDALMKFGAAVKDEFRRLLVRH